MDIKAVSTIHMLQIKASRRSYGHQYTMLYIIVGFTFQGHTSRINNTHVTDQGKPYVMWPSTYYAIDHNAL